MFLYLLSWIAALILLAFCTLCMACGLYYMAEWVEEYTVLSKKIINHTITAVLAVHALFLVFDRVPLYLTLVGVVSHIVYATMLRTFPYFEFSSPQFIGSCVCVVLHHYFTFNFFSSVYFPFSEILAFFTICVWAVPFEFFISLSANEFVLPTTGSGPLPLGNIAADGGAPSGLPEATRDSSRGKSRRQGLLSLFNYIIQKKDEVLPSRHKRV
eukprot:Opistho-1_new@277